MGGREPAEQHLDPLTRRTACLALAGLAAAAPVPAQETPRGFAPPPARASAWPSTADWLVGGGLVAVSFLVDEEAREELSLERGDDLNGLERVGNRFGNPLLVASLIGLGWVGGEAGGSEGLSRGAARAAAGFLATGALTQTLKWAVGRPRPDLGPGAGGLRPGSTDNDHQAWPSGHAAVAFSLATTVAMETENPWIGATAYGLAGVTAWSRVYADRHWTSDVVAGAVIGTLATRATIRWLDARQAAPGSPALVVGPAGVALTFPLP